MQSQISDIQAKLTDAYAEIANLKKTTSSFEQEVHAEYQSLCCRSGRRRWRRSRRPTITRTSSCGCRSSSCRRRCASWRTTRATSS
eukprot:9028870-Lingulodinium_polyedra.AAC.1